MRLEEKLYRVDEVDANSYLLEEAENLTLIDCGMPKSAPAVIDCIQSLGYAPSQLKQVLITHADIDHVGSLAELCQLTGAQAYASRPESQRLVSGKFFRSPRQVALVAGLLKRLFSKLYPQKAVPAERLQVLELGQVLPCWGGLQVVDSSGHVEGHLAFYQPERGILFVGDALNARSGHLALTPGRVTENRVKAVESLKRLKDLQPKAVYCGHGSISGAQAAAELAEFGLTTL